MTLLLSIALKGALILALASGAVALLRGAPAAARHGVWVAAFVALLALPLLATVGPAWEIGVLPSGLAPDAPADPFVVEIPGLPLAPLAPAEPFEVSPQMMAPPFLADAPLAPMTAEFVIAPETSAPARSLGGVLFGIWAAGVGVVLLGWGVTLLAAWLFVRRATPEEDPDWLVAFERARMLSDVDHSVRLLRSDALDVPVAWGLGTPAVVLPADADAWDDDRREAVLLHELAHIRRRDARTQLLAQAAVALHWFDPLAWWAYRRFLVEREHACDDAVLRGGAKPSAYAGHLVDIARGIRRERVALAGLSPMARKSCLEGRVLSILGERRRESLTRVGSFVLAFGAVVLVLPLAACQLTAAASEPDVYHASKPMDRLHVVADREMEDLGEEMEWMEEDLADMEFALADLALDTIPDAETILGPALESALASVRDLRRRGFALSDEDWVEIESEIAEAFEDARADYEEAIAEAMEEMEEEDWQAEMRDALREASIARAEAMADLDRSLQGARLGSSAQRLREAERAREAAQRAVEESRREVERQREAIHEQARREAERARERAKRDAEKSRREAERAREQASRQRPLAAPQAPATPRTTPRVETPRGPSTGYSYSISTGDGHVTVTSTSGPGEWVGALDGWQKGVRNLSRAVAQSTRADELATLDRSVAAMASALDGIGRSANGWAQSSAERRIVREALQDARSDLKDLQANLADAHEDCED
ncbi:M56 family metallopeptidase [Rubricoccus marinus]|uniref:Peptidase M56 domain-containing protein n=1 Tax=Rubricoccus marinus TaxID=716817 RepID=A0A259TWG3_9BACT|nr:M56 family metallopeptidase [Rubricoccus marinus]OZC02122.1 hypothetical protein BSZ36_03455 [Rubricoccus marinus]